MTEMQEGPPELEDALARIEQAKENYASLAKEVHRFLYRYVKGMKKGLDPKTGNFSIQLRHPRESNIKGRPRLLVTQIVENLRSALDYMIFRLSALNEPELNERIPQFVIADNQEAFNRQVKTQLRYLTEEQKNFVERLQPYHGNNLLALIAKIANTGKHRRLLSVEDQTGFDIYFAEMNKKSEYEGCFVYPMEEGAAIFARPKGDGTVLIMDKYSAMPLLMNMIEHTEDILHNTYCFFER